MAYWAIKCTGCGHLQEGDSYFIKFVAQKKPCPKCLQIPRLGFQLMERAQFDRQKTFERDKDTNELTQGKDLAFKIPRAQRERTGNVSFKADLMKDKLLREPDKNRTKKILDMKAKKKTIEDVRNFKERLKKNKRKW